MSGEGLETENIDSKEELMQKLEEDIDDFSNIVIVGLKDSSVVKLTNFDSYLEEIGTLDLASKLSTQEMLQEDGK